MNNSPKGLREAGAARRVAAFVVLLAALALAPACSTKKKVSVPPLLQADARADAAALFAEIDRAAAVRSLRGRVDVQFLDTSFAECGLVDKYRTTEGTVILQRPGQVYLSIQFFSVKIAEMTSDGERFRVAVYQGDEKFKRFVMGTNTAEYERITEDGGTDAAGQPNCGRNENERQEAAMRRTVSSLSSLRPQHLTDALLVRPAQREGSNLIYGVSESFEEEADTRPGAKSGARVVRPYYVMVEIEPQGPNAGRVLRRFWFDRVGALRLARVQNYNGGGALITDVVYRDPRPFGEGGRYQLPALVELTRPQERYSLRIAFQSPDEATIDRAWGNETFVLQNTSNLPEFDLDKRNP
ncbi:MAG TPA: hypothetical protein VER32_10410 [Pyrinomonadaceae bacterium]|nr:hypothetical protein [Pyrinomonadaceae bacterium]